jgi:hypothetical protein
MHFVVDASLAAAWLLPEEYSEAAETAIASISEPCPGAVTVLVRDSQHFDYVRETRPDRAGWCAC